jgi:hypothetical protein
MKKSNLIILIIVSTILCFTQTIQAKTFHVADGRELFLAFSEASDNGEDDIVYIAAGVYKGEFIFETSEANALTITSEPGLSAEQVVFDGEEMVRPLYISADVESDFEVGNITVRNGKVDGNGGGIYINTYANVNFYGNIVADNHAESGGGAYIKSNGMGKITITKNIIIGNTSNSNSSSNFHGGGIYTYSKGHISFTNNNVTGNTSSSSSYSSCGGGIYANASGDISFTNNNVTSNTSSFSYPSYSGSGSSLSSRYSYGGGIYANASGDISFTNNNVTGNNSFSYFYHSYGGGIYANASGDISFTNNNVTGNNSSSNNYSNYGGGIYVNASGNNISFTNNNVTKNTSHSSRSNSHGGAIFINNTKKIIFLKNVISKNIATAPDSSYNSYGGAIFLNSGVKEITAIENIITENFSEIGGGIFTHNTEHLILSNNTITQNNSDGIRSTKASCIDISSNTIKGSTGTGIYITSSSETSITCTITNNVIMNYNNPSNDGGGIFVENYQLININQNNIANNKATKGAGIYLNPASSLFLINNTITSNTAENQGGGIYIATSNMLSDLSLKNNIFWKNTALIEGDDIHLHGFGANPRELYNNTVREISGSFENSSGNISTDPLFFSPETGDYHLKPNSPCINAGNQSLTTTDLDGTPRIGTTDMGAYEYNPTIPHPADTNKNFIIETSEYEAYNDSWHEYLPWSTEPTEIEIDYSTRAGFLVESGGSYTNTGAMKPFCWIPTN